MKSISKRRYDLESQMPSRGQILETPQGIHSSEDGWITTKYIEKQCVQCKTNYDISLMWTEEEDIPKNYICDSCLYPHKAFHNHLIQVGIGILIAFLMLTILGY